MNNLKRSKVLQKWLSTARIAIRRWWRSLNPPPQVSAAAPVALEALPTESEQVSPESDGSVEVQALSRQITAYCATCSAIHELNLVCVLCGATLCDTSTCSVKQEDDLMEQEIVLCHTCAAERVA